MKKHLTLLFALSALGAHAQNDCANAVPVGAGIFVVDTVDGTQPPINLCIATGGAATRAEWYTYTPAANYGLTITTDLVENSGGDTRFQVYTGTCSTLVCAGGDDDGGVIGNGYLSVDSFNVLAGTTYYIVFDDGWNTRGFTFQIIEGDSIEGPVEPPPPIAGIGFNVVAVPANGTAGVVDMTGDHLDDVVSVTANSIRVSAQQTGGGFVNTDVTTPTANYTPSWSMAVGDIDNNGRNDLLYGSGSGVTFMVANATGTAYTELSGAEYVFSQRSNFVDINADGNLDAFVCHDVDANVFYMSDGQGGLTFNQGGLGETCGNYGSIWVDYDGDQDMDLFVAKCGCDPVDILYRNNGDGTFSNVAAALGFADSQQSWSSAWGDFNNDGHMDVLVGTSSTGAHKLMRNNGNGTFTNVTPGSGFDTFTGTSIEWTTHDFDNDGYLDILGGNMLLMGAGDFTFITTDITPNNGPIGDLNNDGFLDILNSGNAYMNETNDNNWLKVNCTGTSSNLNGIGARVRIQSAMGTQIREIRSGDGFRHMSTLNAHFGIGSDTEIESVTVFWPSGIVDVITNPTINTTLVVVESGSTDVDENTAQALAVYPNPANDRLNVVLPAGTTMARARVIDLAGKTVLTTNLGTNGLDISGLAAGTYVMEVELTTGSVQARFAKQ